MAKRPLSVCPQAVEQFISFMNQLTAEFNLVVSTWNKPKASEMLPLVALLHDHFPSDEGVYQIHELDVAHSNLLRMRNRLQGIVLSSEQAALPPHPQPLALSA